VLFVGAYGGIEMTCVFLTGTQIKTNRNLILLIISFIHYWAGNIQDTVKQALNKWMPKEMEHIPLQTWDPENVQVIPIDAAE
jgi:hypothetical protein